MAGMKTYNALSISLLAKAGVLRRQLYVPHLVCVAIAMKRLRPISDVKISLYLKAGRHLARLCLAKRKWHFALCLIENHASKITRQRMFSAEYRNDAYIFSLMRNVSCI